MGEVAAFPRSWKAEILSSPPLIRPARQFVYPLQIAGEEETLARGALELMVRPRIGGPYLATCALGFRDPRLPTDVFGCPDPDEMCALAGGYAYLADTTAPERSTLLSMKPVEEVHVLLEARLLVFRGFHTLMAWGQYGFAWETQRLTWEGLRITGIAEGRMDGMGWDMHTDREKAFSVDLADGTHTGGAFRS